MKYLIFFLIIYSHIYSQDKKTFDVLIIGDSYSTIEYSYSNQLFYNTDANVKYIAETGKTTGWALLELEKDTNKYDISIIFIGTNDVYNNVDLQSTIKNLESIFLNLNKKSIPIIAITLPYTFNYIEFNDYMYIRLYVINEFIKKYPDIISIDINEFIMNFHDSKSLFMSDSIHLSKKGHYYLSLLIMNELMKY